MRRSIALGAVATLALAATSLAAQDAAPPRPVFNPDGSVQVPAFELPVSELSSPEAQKAQAMRSKRAGSAPRTDDNGVLDHSSIDAMLFGQVDRMRALHPVDITDQVIAGVLTRVITPKDKPFDKQRVLINLHGGGFSACADACALLESVPIAGLGGFKVVTVNYRQAPQAQHPAAVEDVAKVYGELLKSYKPKQIGIYGCSAGGALSAQAASYLPSHGLPQAGAIGIFGAGAVRFKAGDSAWIAAYIDGSFPPPAKAGEKNNAIGASYFGDADMNDPVISPALHPDILARFPPTLIITGTRSMDMSPAIYTNSKLIKAGVRSTLIVEEGMGHCYIYQPDLPEARDGWQAIVNFFKANLK